MANVKSFGAVGDGKADDTSAILHALKDGDGVLRFPQGAYRITKTIEILLDKQGRLGIDGSDGTATIVMAGAGPAFRIVGTHGGTGDPGSVDPKVWLRQRLPTIRNIEFTGDHPEADGFELIETMQAVVDGVLVRNVRNGIRLHRRNRNVLIANSHVYHNTGVGLFLDQVNLHQINVTGNHISYNRLGGIRIEGSEVRNLQITGNDIEYNNHRAHGTEPQPTAEIHIDTTAEGASVNEVAIASNTIQATDSPAGANIRILEKPTEGRPPGLFTITGNIIGSQENNVHLIGCYGIVISGNCIYSCSNRNLLVENSSHINIVGNSFRRHTPRYGTGVRLIESKHCVISACTMQDESENGQVSGASLLELQDCERIIVQGSQFVDGRPASLDVLRGNEINVNGCQLGGVVRFRGAGKSNQIAASTFDQTNAQIAAEADVQVSDCR